MHLCTGPLRSSCTSAIISAVLLITNAEDSVKRNSFDSVLKSKILLRDSNGISGLKKAGIFIQADRSDILTAFYFHRDD